MPAESVNHNCVSDLQPDFCGTIVERDTKLVQSDLSGLLDLSFIGCYFLCILPEEVAVLVQAFFFRCEILIFSTYLIF